MGSYLNSESFREQAIQHLPEPRTRCYPLIVSRQLPAALDRYLTVPQLRDRSPQSLHSLSVTWKPERHQIRLRVEAK